MRKGFVAICIVLCALSRTEFWFGTSWSNQLLGECLEKLSSAIKVEKLMENVNVNEHAICQLAILLPVVIPLENVDFFSIAWNLGWTNKWEREKQLNIGKHCGIINWWRCGLDAQQMWVDISRRLVFCPLHAIALRLLVNIANSKKNPRKTYLAVTEQQLKYQ